MSSRPKYKPVSHSPCPSRACDSHTRAVVGLCTAEQGENMVSRIGKKGLCDELKYHKHKQGVRRNALRLKPSSDETVGSWGKLSMR